MADEIIAVVQDPTQSTITTTDDSGSTTIITSTTLSNPTSVDTISSIGNVDTTNLENGAVLVYKIATSKWTSTTALDSQNMEGGEF